MNSNDKMVIYYTHDFRGGREESRRLLRKAISVYTGSEEAARELVSSLVTSGGNGKPCIPGFEHFSVSHSENTWAVLIMGSPSDQRDIPEAGTCACGLDIQYPRTVDAAAVAARFYAAQDAREVVSSAGHGGPEEETADANACKTFFRLWTRREALIKAAGASVTDTQVPPVSGESVIYDGAAYRITDISLPGADVFAAVCTEAKDDADSPEQLLFIKLDREASC